MLVVQKVRFKCLFITCLLTFVVRFVDHLTNHVEQKLVLSHSSVWCSSDSHTKSCKFHHLLYNKNVGFMFILTNSSIISGLESYEELKTLKLSPINDHKAVQMKLIMVLPSHNIIRDIVIVKGSHFLIHRFKPDNFMHVIHDDLIPLFQKYKELCFGNVTHCSYKFRLIFSDFNSQGPYMQWYRALSSHEPILSSQFSRNATVCFSSVVVGVSETSFFQYGFNKVQGPLTSKLSGVDLVEFKHFFLNYFQIHLKQKQQFHSITVISRSVNRKILNPEYIVDVLSNLLKNAEDFKGNISIENIDMIQNCTKSILNRVASSDILVGMHGAETMLSIFLPPASVFIELFPFGIFRENVSPIFSLRSQTTTHFAYLSWHNMIEFNSVVHPEYPIEFGGIQEFSQNVQERIIITKVIPAVECCNNPYYLFRMYQDTVIDDSFAVVGIKAVELLTNRVLEINVFDKWFFPGPVRDLTCSVHSNQLTVSWSVPFNLESAQAPLVYFNVSALLMDEHLNFITKTTTVKIERNKKISSKCQVWVNCLLGSSVSVDSYTPCTAT